MMTSPTTSSGLVPHRQMERGLHRQMQTCPTGEVRGSKRKGLLKPRSGFFGGTAAKRWGSQNPEGSALAAREGRALSLQFCLSLILQKQLDMRRDQYARRSEA